MLRRQRLTRPGVRPGGRAALPGDTAQINLLVNRTSRLADVDSYLLVDDLKPGDEIVLSFTVPKSTASHTATTGSGAKSASTPSRCAEHHRIGIAKPNEPRDTPIYRRAHLRSDQAPMVWVERFVPERELRSW